MKDWMLPGILVFGMALVILLWAMPAVSYSQSRNDSTDDRAQQSCIKQGGVPILSVGSGTMSKCEFKEVR